MSVALALIVEIVIGGALSTIWLFLILNLVLGHQLDGFISILSFISSTGVAGMFIFIVLVYIIGWTSQFFGDMIFDPIQKKIGYEPFTNPEDFRLARTNVFQNGSDTIIADIQYDRQILRISKHICTNLFMTFIVLLFYFSKRPMIVLSMSFLSLVLCVSSFFHWKKRFSDTMKKFFGADDNIKKNIKKK